MNDWQVYRRLLGYVTPQWPMFSLSLVGYVIYSLGNVLLADLMQFLLDSLDDSVRVTSGIVSSIAYRFFDNSGLGRVEFARIAVPVAMVTLAATRASGFFMGNYCMSHVARTLIHRLRCQLFDKMLVAPSIYYDAHTQGALISKITFNVEQVTGAVTKALKIVVREGLTVIALASYLLYLNWRLCLVFIAVIPVIAVVVTYVGRHFRRYSRRIQSSMGDVTQVSGESVSGYKEIRLFGGQRQQHERFRDASQYNRVQNLKLAFADGLSTPVIQTLLALALATLVWFALSPDILRGFTAGSLVAFLTAATQLGKPIRQLSEVQSDIQRGLAAAEDIFAQLDLEEESDHGRYEVARAAGAISVRGVSFAYRGNPDRVLHDVSIDIPAGKTVALVGRSGSGKSTLVHLLARFYQPGEGEILLDGVPLADYRLANLRAQLAMVSQHVALFHDTVYNNIAYGALADRGEDAVLAATESAYARHFIEALPRGFQTVLGDDGGGLSGGQRQRIAIARAILKDAPVLILDEATSALDNESEHRIQRALDNVMANRTTIVIAHRLSTVEHADSIVVMDAGRVVACGNHQSLLQEGGLYAQLYHQKFSL
ncbi:MAG: lipid A export permease/ATP-binding protein MsbA [Pseudomonadales bacterium]|nr:lipid A export permease/ATP-binding protein MsbA [Halioglobus sp.]MCP5123885.1 lipid A export permease/ATP-binding protein MsbA [Pseudomonadales bacterium]MCP5192700.1 lipid A export permease/ATP-binding protein MsbA [Pseudomonadales bacterium]